MSADVETKRNKISMINILKKLKLIKLMLEVILIDVVADKC